MGKWVSASSGPHYYSHIGQLRIPGCRLGLGLVNTDAASNPDRRALFDKLGVMEALVKDIRALIMQKSVAPVADTIAIWVSFSRLEFLYLSETLLEDGEVPVRLKGFEVYDQCHRAFKPTGQRAYISTDDEYGPSQLLAAKKHAPGLRATFLHGDYLTLVGQSPTPQGLTYSWEEWLALRLRLNRHLRLTMKDSQGVLKINSEFRYLERYRPDRLLGALQRAWEIEGTRVVAYAELLEELRGLEVPCKGKDNFSLGEPLSTTYLPLPELEGKLSRYIEDEGLLFLDLGEPITSSTYTTKWGFLVDHLGVGHTDDLRFYLSILKTIRYSNTVAEVRRNARILDLYEVIHARCREADSFLDAQADAR